ncbi:hypothetical protein JCM6882_003226 [Rhodosporidiobolus microsporus]
MADRYITLWDLAHGADIITTVIVTASVQHNMPIPGLPRFAGATALALMPIEAIFEGGPEKEARLKEVLAWRYPGAKTKNTYLPLNEPNGVFYLKPTFWNRSDDQALEAILRESLRDTVILPSAIDTTADTVVVSSAQSILMEQIHGSLTSGPEVFARTRTGAHISERERANFCLPFVVLEALKMLCEAQQRHGPQAVGGPFGLTPHQVQSAFEEHIINFPAIANTLKKEWLMRVHLEGPSMRFISEVSKEAVVWLYGKWKASPEGKRQVGLHGHEEKEKWVLKRRRELQDTKNWTIWLVDSQTRHKSPSERPMKAALQHEVPQHLRPV